ncbi:MAG: 50S ribosomal protein L20 [Chlamydiae bacterium]|nr:50S ribosomal protein L20 [Chlamydiota bacterium]
MVRVTNAVASRKRKKRIFKRAKGFVGDRKNHLRLTSDAVMRAMAFNYRHRKHNKRNFRSLWIVRIGIASKINGISYSKMMNGLKKAGCEINRKMLADLAVHDPASFTQIANTAKMALAS